MIMTVKDSTTDDTKQFYVRHGKSYVKSSYTDPDHAFCFRLLPLSCLVEQEKNLCPSLVLYTLVR